MSEDIQENPKVLAQQVKNRLKDFEIPVSERLTKLKLIKKLIENTDEDNLNENIKAICKMLTDVKKIYYFNVSDLNKWDFKKLVVYFYFLKNLKIWLNKICSINRK